MELSGLDTLADLLRDTAIAGESAVADTVLQLVNDTSSIAKQNMTASSFSADPGYYPHSKSGRLENSIFAEVEMVGAGVEGAVGTQEIHGYYLEFGTESMPARPWLVPSFEEATWNAQQKLAEKLKERV